MGYKKPHGLIVLSFNAVMTFRISYLFHQLVNAAQPVEEFKVAAVSEGKVTDEDFHAYLVYCSGESKFLTKGNIQQYCVDC